MGMFLPKAEGAEFKTSYRICEYLSRIADALEIIAGIQELEEEQDDTQENL